MITIQVVGKQDVDVYKILREKVDREAQTWSWKDKAKTKLVHRKTSSGYIAVASSQGILIAKIYPQNGKPYFLVERFIGRLVDWFCDKLFSINVQFLPDTPSKVR